MDLAITRLAHGGEPECVRILCNSDAEALSEVWRILTGAIGRDLVALDWRRSDGAKFDLVYLQKWASQR